MLNLIELIKASGNAGTSGQSFAGHVAGSPGAGATMSSYRLMNTGGTGTVGGFSVAPTATGHTFEVVITFSNYGSRFQHIRRNGLTPWTGFGGSGLTVNSVTWNEGAGTVTFNVTAPNVYDAATMPTLGSPEFRAWYIDGSYPYPDVPAGTADWAVRVDPLLSGGGGSPSGYNDYTFGPFTYDPDTAAFNPEFSSGITTYTVRINKLAYPAWTVIHDLEAHDSLSYVNEIDRTIDSGPNTTFNWYIRWRLKTSYGGDGSWNNHGLVSWSDPRLDI